MTPHVDAPPRWIGGALIGAGVAAAVVLVADNFGPRAAVGMLLIVCSLAGLCGVLLGTKQPATPPAYPDQDRLDRRAADLAEELPVRAGSPTTLNLKEVIQESRGATAQRGQDHFSWEYATAKISPPPPSPLPPVDSSAATRPPQILP